MQLQFIIILCHFCFGMLNTITTFGKIQREFRQKNVINLNNTITGDEYDLDWINLGVKETERHQSRYYRRRDLNRFLSVLHRSYRTGEELCFDKQSKDCVEWEKLGYCKHSKSSYSKWMTENCRLSCKICEDTQTEKDKICTPEKSSKNCQTWAKLGYCTHQSRRYRIWMQENCPSSCNDTCSEPQEQPCENKREFCDILFRFCKSRFRNYMLDWCPRTCKVCFPRSSSVAKSSSGSRVTSPIRNANQHSRNSDKKTNRLPTVAANKKVCFPTKCGLTPTNNNRQKRSIASKRYRLRPNVSLKIVGGARSKKGRWPWHGLLMHQISGRVRFCGITIICKQWLVTAAHCVLTRKQDFNITRKNLDAYTIYVGRYDGPYGYSDENTQVFGKDKIDKIVVHPYFRFSPHFAHDIALVKLKKFSEIQFSSVVQPVCLPTKNDLEQGDFLTTYGWGDTKGYGPSSRRLKEIDLPFVPFKRCRKLVWGLYDRGTLCAGGEQNKDTCTGDSGGSLVMQGAVNTDPGDRRFLFYGITSYGSHYCNTRSPSNPGVYTDVAYYHKWIIQQTNGCCE